MYTFTQPRGYVFEIRTTITIIISEVLFINYSLSFVIQKKGGELNFSEAINSSQAMIYLETDSMFHPTYL